MPDVEFERGHLTESEERRQVVGEQVVVLLVLAAREHGDLLDVLGPRLAPVLLEEALAVDALGHADHRERPILEMRQHVGRDAREIANQVALGDFRMPRALVAGPVDAIEICQADFRPAGGVVRPFRGFSSCCRTSPISSFFFVTLPASAPACGPLLMLRAETSSRILRKTGARRFPDGVQPEKFTSATSFGSTQVVGRCRSTFSSNGAILRTSGFRRFCRSLKDASVRPEPTWPTYFSLLPCQ